MHQLTGIGTKPSPNEARFQHGRTAERDDPLHPQPSGREQLADGDDVLVIQMPNRSRCRYRVQKVDMRADEPGGMGPLELCDLDRTDVPRRDVRIRVLADKYLALGEP